MSARLSTDSHLHSRFLTDLITRDLTGKLAEAHEPLVYLSHFAGGLIVVPKGFKSDWASIPQAVQSVIPRNGLWDWAAWIHDLLYGYNGAVPIIRADGHVFVSGLDREGCDLVLLEAMRVKGVEEWQQKTIFEAVRLGGESAWAGHSSERDVYPLATVKEWKALAEDAARQRAEESARG